MTGRSSDRRRQIVPCSIAIETSYDNLFAHVDLDGVVVGPGDTVRVFEAPADARPGIAITYRRLAEVRRAGFFERILVRLGEPLRLLSLTEVGFSGREQP
jgi:hypothetical protein